jgi:hypothetical protein
MPKCKMLKAEKQNAKKWKKAKSKMLKCEKQDQKWKEAKI